MVIIFKKMKYVVFFLKQTIYYLLKEWSLRALSLLTDIFPLFTFLFVREAGLVILNRDFDCLNRKIKYDKHKHLLNMYRIY